MVTSTHSGAGCWWPFRSPSWRPGSPAWWWRFGGGIPTTCSGCTGEPTRSPATPSFGAPRSPRWCRTCSPRPRGQLRYRLAAASHHGPDPAGRRRARDRFYSPELFQETAERIPGARLRLYPGKGHAGVMTHGPAIREIAFLRADTQLRTPGFAPNGQAPTCANAGDCGHLSNAPRITRCSRESSTAAKSR